MSVVYVNGRWQNYLHAGIHVEDRGFQFADGVYEMLGVREKQILDVAQHLARLEYSLREIELSPPVAFSVLPFLMQEAVERNRLRAGSLYLQITRGAAKRDHAFPSDTQSSLIIIARARPLSAAAKRKGVHVVTHADERWKRCDIKSLNLLANVLARQNALQQDAQEAWLYNEQGIITEGAVSNAWIIIGDRLLTHEANRQILNGITRQTILGFAAQCGLKLDFSGFTCEQALGAGEAFISSSIGGIIPVLSVDGMPKPVGEKTQALQNLLESSIQEFIAQNKK